MVHMMELELNIIVQIVMDKNISLVFGSANLHSLFQQFDYSAHNFLQYGNGDGETTDYLRSGDNILHQYILK